MATMLVAHGAWAAGWFWRKMRPLLREFGHDLITPTLTGLGERSHLAHQGVDLETHVSDIVQVLDFEDLHNVMLVGHSYGGMVATVVADRVAERFTRLVYVDAFVPQDGECLLDLLPHKARASMLDAARVSGEGWRVPPNLMPPDTSETDRAWAVPRRVMQPLKTFTQPVRLSGAVYRLPRTYIYCTHPASDDVFRQFADRARGEAGWTYIELDASHNPHVTAPERFATLLDEQARERV